MSQITGYIGRQTVRTLDRVSNQLAFNFSLLRILFQHQKTGAALIRRFTLEQIYFTGYQALYVIIPIALLIGGANIVMFSKVPGQFDLARTMAMLLIREIGPLVTALVVILRSATAVTIEIGYMKVLHEIETIEMAGIDPLRIICLPRLVGMTSAVLCLFIVFALVATVGGYTVVWTLAYAPIGNFIGQISLAITVSDILVGIFKALCFGITITVICLYHGFETKLEITEIPVRTSKVAIECFFYCLITNVIISIIF